MSLGIKVTALVLAVVALLVAVGLWIERGASRNERQ
jgi:uncharacterized membrane protein